MDTKLKQIIATSAAKAGSLNRLCKLAGVPQSSVSDWMRGKTGISWRHVCTLLEYLGIDLVQSETTNN